MTDEDTRHQPREEEGSAGRTTLPAELEPEMPEHIRSSIHKIFEGLGHALRLTKGYGSYDEDSGEPLDSDAETEALCLNTREHAGKLEDSIKEWQRDHLLSALEAYKDHLYYDASKGFEYQGLDEQTTGDELTGRYEAAYEAAQRAVPNLNGAIFLRKGIETLADEVRQSIPPLRENAARPCNQIPPGESFYSEKSQENHQIHQDRESLVEKEAVLDTLIYHLGYHLDANPDFTSGLASGFATTPSAAAPLLYALVLYHQEPGPENPEDPEDPKRSETTGKIVGRFATEEVAATRADDISAGLLDTVPDHLEGCMETGTLVVEKTARAS